MYIVKVFYYKGKEELELFTRKIEKYEYSDLLGRDIYSIIEKYYKTNISHNFKKPFPYRILVTDEKNSKSKKEFTGNID